MKNLIYENSLLSFCVIWGWSNWKVNLSKNKLDLKKNYVVRELPVLPLTPEIHNVIPCLVNVCCLDYFWTTTAISFLLYIRVKEEKFQTKFFWISFKTKLYYVLHLMTSLKQT